jgi:hypothetical protein
MTKEQLTQYKRNWYQENKKHVQYSRILKGLKNDTRAVTEKTLQKYGFEKDKNIKIILKETPKVRYSKSDFEQPNVVNIVIKNDRKLHRHMI